MKKRQRGEILPLLFRWQWTSSVPAPPSVGFADSSPGGGAKGWDLIRRFAPPVCLTVPEKHFRLTLILVFFDRCGKGVSPSYPRRLG